MSWTSPSPAGGARPPAPPPHALWSPPPPAPAPPRRTRTGLIVLLIALPLAVVVAASVVLVTFLGGTRQLSDAQGRVTLTVPRTWANDAGEDAGQYVEQGEESYTVPDIETGGMLADVVVFVEPREGGSLPEAHQANVDEECELTGCISRGQPAATDVNGRRALQQVLHHPEGDITAVLTVESETLVVTVLGFAIEEDQEKVIELLRTVVVNR